MVAIEGIRLPLQDHYRAAIVMVIYLPNTLKMIADLAPVLERVAIH